MSNNFSRQVATLRRDERGQIAILMVLVLPVIFLFFSLALDAGVWFLDHRLAQNQVDAATLAAVQYLPAEEFSANHILAEAAVKLWLEKNGSGLEELCDQDENGPYPQFTDIHPSIPDGRLDAIRVCVRRKSPSIFAGLAGLDSLYISAVAGARVGPISSAQVMPWGLVPADPECSTGGDRCVADMDGDGQVGESEWCGWYPPVPPGEPEELCPWGMNENMLWVFKFGDPVTPGNFSPISACGLGAVEYIDCIEGELASEFYGAGETVNVGVQPGNLGILTAGALDVRYAHEQSTGPGELECDVEATPLPINGYDPDGKDLAWEAYVSNPGGGCERRLVSVPVLHSLPEQGNEDVQVLGIATFAIAKWDRTFPTGDALGNAGNFPGDPAAEPCGEAGGPGPPPDPSTVFECHMAWGYFMRDVRPPSVLLAIGDTDNPFAPNMIAMIE